MCGGLCGGTPAGRRDVNEDADQRKDGDPTSTTGANHPGKLTRKQAAFVEFYLACWDMTKAAERAGYRFPNKRGWELVRHPTIKAAIETRMQEAAMSANEVLARLAEQARVNMGDFVSEDGGELTVNWEAVREHGYLVKKISQTANGPAVELHDGQAALVHIGRHLGLFTERVEMSGKSEVIVQVVRGVSYNEL